MLPPWECLVSSSHSDVFRYRDRYLGKLYNGGYAWHMPFRKDQFELEECCVLDYERNIIKDVWWDMEDMSDVNVFVARSQNNGT